jgi:hypothetical protein
VTIPLKLGKTKRYFYKSYNIGLRLKEMFKIKLKEMKFLDDKLALQIYVLDYMENNIYRKHVKYGLV